MAKAASQAPRLPPAVDPVRVRRMSDPVSPSPRNLEFPAGVQAVLNSSTADARAKKSEATPKSKGKAKRVTIEVVSDEEDAEVDAMERLPVDSKFIFEPKPSAPPERFARIIDFEDEAAGGAKGGKEKDKHARWSPAAPPVEIVAVESTPAAGKKGARGRAGSLMQPTSDRKGKGKARAAEPEGDDDLARMLKGATQDLSKMRG